MLAVIALHITCTTAATALVHGPQLRDTNQHAKEGVIYTATPSHDSNLILPISPSQSSSPSPSAQRPLREASSRATPTTRDQHPLTLHHHAPAHTQSSSHDCLITHPHLRRVRRPNRSPVRRPPTPRPSAPVTSPPRHYRLRKKALGLSR